MKGSTGRQGTERRSVVALLLALLLLIPAGSIPAASALVPLTVPRFTDRVALYDAAIARVAVSSGTASVNYTVSSLEGKVLRQGTVAMIRGAGGIDLRALGPGYYRLAVRNSVGTVATDLGIVARLGAATTASPFGISAHPGLHWGVNHTDVSKALGVTTTRVDWRWERMATLIPGVYHWDTVSETEIKRLIARGIRPSLVLAYHGLCDGARTPSSSGCIAEYAEFARATARKFGTSVDYAVYNEWNADTNTSACGRTADCYLKVLKPAAAAIRQAAPGARILGPALGAVGEWWAVNGAAYTWFSRFVALGGAALVDQVTIHNYSLTTPPDGKGERAVRNAKAILAAARISKPVVMEEAGYTTVAGGLPEYLQAAFLARDAAAVLTAGAAKYMPYDMIDDYMNRNNGESNFGLFRHEKYTGGRLVPKPGAVTLATLSRLLNGAVPLGEEKLLTGTRSMAWRMADGRTLRIVWTTDTTRILELSAGTGLGVTDGLGRKVTTYPSGTGQRVIIGGLPVFITTPAAVTARVV